MTPPYSLCLLPGLAKAGPHLIRFSSVTDHSSVLTALKTVIVYTVQFAGCLRQQVELLVNASWLEVNCCTQPQCLECERKLSVLWLDCKLFGGRDFLFLVHC